ncbi:hypothetical protein R3Q06_17330 [Rhodococcus erythropolis]|uniref:hypothetical protein n=1 Tax=Rhodococcus erythropolis TaxID=1833 RepID=UPI002949C98A|nr:hypothetical protein [Rhodococcus erythropolis]MDV6275261.1 hypothetical protein [Rhodococcus erythropolis]
MITGILIVLALVAVAAVVPGSHRRPGMPTDWAGAGALAFGLVSLPLAITKTSDWGVLSLGFRVGPARITLCVRRCGRTRIVRGMKV